MRGRSMISMACGWLGGAKKRVGLRRSWPFWRRVMARARQRRPGPLVLEAMFSRGSRARMRTAEACPWGWVTALTQWWRP